MRLLFTLFSTVLFLVHSNGQNIIYVNNANNGSPSDYTSLQDAVDAASAGDILYIYPSPYNYGDVTINKKLLIVGPGYDIPVNSTLGSNANLDNTNIDDITLGQGSDQTVIRGCKIKTVAILQTTNIVIQYNFLSSQLYLASCSGININGNYLTYIISGNSEMSNIEISNNYFSSTSNSSLSFAILKNNIIRNSNLFFNNSSIYNNIFPLNGIFISSGNIVNNNIFVKDYTDYAQNNLINVAEDAIFIGYPTQDNHSFDARWQLKADAPAKGYGFDGTDCGIFGGTSPYRLSGLSTIPYIYQLNAPISVGQNDNLNVTIKARSGN